MSTLIVSFFLNFFSVYSHCLSDVTISQRKITHCAHCVYKCPWIFACAIAPFLAERNFPTIDFARFEQRKVCCQLCSPSSEKCGLLCVKHTAIIFSAYWEACRLSCSAISKAYAETFHRFSSEVEFSVSAMSIQLMLHGD
ncbi:hypothetical protein M514_16179 [Trichuris suis]|uniref:Secreted protein n=1 Tax=Trichuris suis TaxID=68888 RepID=A0A085NQB3_9BILA|nr:hypothetical protein M514_16179 [Trichuris suis]